MQRAAGGFVDIRCWLAAGNPIAAEDVIEVGQQPSLGQFFFHDGLSGGGGETNRIRVVPRPLQQLACAGLDRYAFGVINHMVTAADGVVKFLRRKIGTVALAQDAAGVHACGADGGEKDGINSIRVKFRCNFVPASAHELFRVQNDAVHIKNQGWFGLVHGLKSSESWCTAAVLCGQWCPAPVR